MSEPNRSDALEHLAELEGRAALDASSSVERALSRQRFLARLDGELSRPRRFLPSFRWALPAAVLVSVAAALPLWPARPRARAAPRPGALWGGERGAERGAKPAGPAPGGSAELRFSDDSTVVATSG